ncbi:putative membrane protein [Mycobacterium xenopi 3993]|nr:putative membrane protein [Mycobacterium xenopi 3993]
MTTTAVLFVIEFADVVVGLFAGLILFVCTVSVTRNWWVRDTR